MPQNKTSTKKINVRSRRGRRSTSVLPRKQAWHLRHIHVILLFILILVVAGVTWWVNVSDAATHVKGDVNTSTVEQRLLQDPNVLWVGTADHPTDWKTNFGVVQQTATQNAAQVTPPTPWRGKAVRIRNPGIGKPNSPDERWGYSGYFDFEKMGISRQEEVYFRYYVWIPSNLSRQGKLPGLKGIVDGGTLGELTSNVKCQDKYSHVTPSHDWYNETCFRSNKFGARTMWKWWGSNPANIGMITYMCANAIGDRDCDTSRTAPPANHWYPFSIRYTNPASASKSDTSKFIKFNKGSWNYVEQRIKMNTPGQKNGIYEGWINGVKGVSLNNVVWRESAHASMKISHWELVAFWGGPQSDYPTEQTDFYFDDFVISKAPIGPRDDTPAGPQPDLVVTNIDTIPANPATGQPATLTATIKNQGEAATPTDCGSTEPGYVQGQCIHGVLFKVDGSIVAWSDSSRTSLAPGQSRTVTSNGGPGGSDGSWLPSTSGAVTVTAEVDDRNRIAESNETNNSNTTTMSVTDPVPLPGDVNGDGSVTATDLSIVLMNYGKAGVAKSSGDTNEDGVVNGLDLSEILTSYRL